MKTAFDIMILLAGTALWIAWLYGAFTSDFKEKWEERPNMLNDKNIEK